MLYSIIKVAAMEIRILSTDFERFIPDYSTY
jgi:hypothetical protein